MIARRSLAVLKTGIEQRMFSGAGYALVSKQASGGVGTVGRVSFDDECDRVDRDTQFDVASLTKPLATAMSVLQLADRGLLDLDAPVAAIFAASDSVGGIPSAPCDTERSETSASLADITVRHLLTHTSGLPAIPTGSETQPARARELAFASRPTSAPGSSYLYSDTGYILLGELVAKVSGRSLDRWFDLEIAAPLHLETSGFRPSPARRIVATAHDEQLDALPHDPRARAMGGVAGHAGLFASIADIAAYARALLGSGRALLGASLFDALFAPAIPIEVGGQTLAFFSRGNPLLPEIDGFGDGTVGHSGFTGCFMMLDRCARTAACLLTNRVLGAATQEEFLAFRREWLTAAAQDLA